MPVRKKELLGQKNQKRVYSKEIDHLGETGVAYAIMCHSSRDWIAEQLELIWRPENFYFYHIDDKAPQSLKNLVAAISADYSNVFVVPSILCSWAGFSLVDAMLTLVSWAVTKAERWTHLIFLSEQHLPLVNYATIRRTLKPESSYLTNVPFEAFSGIPRADIAHRVSSEYVEVPGVGEFYVRSCIRDQGYLNRLHHGSQWMILNRSVCLALHTDRHGEFWDTFRNTLLSDETAIQSWLAQCSNPSVHEYKKRNLTLVAAPIDGGNPDMTFTDTAFFSAVKNDFLFIRKRPNSISTNVRKYIQDKLPGEISLSKFKSYSVSRPSINFSSHIVESLFFTLGAAMARYQLEILKMPSQVAGPLFFGMINNDNKHLGVSVFILSGDLQTFKVSAISNLASTDYSPGQSGPYETTLIKVRAANVWHHREIHFGSDLNYGIVTVSSLQDIDRLARMIHTYVRRVEHLISS